jgi:hypothetical protein
MIQWILKVPKMIGQNPFSANCRDLLAGREPCEETSPTFMNARSLTIPDFLFIKMRLIPCTKNKFSPPLFPLRPIVLTLFFKVDIIAATLAAPAIWGWGLPIIII